MGKNKKVEEPQLRLEVNHSHQNGGDEYIWQELSMNIELEEALLLQEIFYMEKSRIRWP